MALKRAVEINHGRGLPGTPLFGHTLERSRKGLVHRLLGKIEIPEQADQRCQDSSRIHAIQGVEQFADLLGGALGHDDDLSKPATPNKLGTGREHRRRTTRDPRPAWLTSLPFRFAGGVKVG